MTFLKSPTLVRIKITINHVHILSFSSFKIRFNIIIQSSPRCSDLSLSFGFIHQTILRFSVPLTCYMHRLFYSSRFDYSNNIRRAPPYEIFSIHLLRPLTQHRILEHHSSLKLRARVSHFCIPLGKIAVLFTVA